MGRTASTRVAAGLIAALGTALGAGVATGHQSGCHRWHSCPSDTGSYVCGDLGYPCQYPTYPTDPIPTYPPPAPVCDGVVVRDYYYGPYARARWPYVRCSLQTAGFADFTCVGSGSRRKWPCQVITDNGASYLVWFHVTRFGSNVITVR